MKKILFGVILAIGSVVMPLSVAQGTPKWTTTGSCTLVPASPQDPDLVPDCNQTSYVTPQLSAAFNAAYDTVLNEYVRSTGSTGGVPFAGPWTYEVDSSPDSVEIRFTALPKEGKEWTSTYTGDGVPFYQTAPVPDAEKTLKQSYAAFYQWGSDVEGAYDLTNPAADIGTTGDYTVTASGHGNVGVLTVSRSS